MSFLSPEFVMKGYAYNAALVQLGKLIQMGIVDENTSIEKITDLLNEKLRQLNLPTLEQGDVTAITVTIKGFGIFKREAKHPTIV